MIVRLEKKDLVNLVYGCSPSYEQMGFLEKEKLGWYIGGFEDRWAWDRSALEKCSEEQLWDCYQGVK